MIIDLVQLKTHLPGVTLGDEALQDLLNANTHAIEHLVGPIADATELRFPRAYESIIFLGRRPTAILEVKEAVGFDDELTLDSEDYLLSGATVRRRETGPNPRQWWTGPVQFLYSWEDDLAERIRVLVGLVKLDINHNPGLKGFTVGQHREEYDTAGQSTPTYEQKRDALLASLESTSAVPFA